MVEQQELDRCTPPLELRSQFDRIEVGRLRSERRDRGPVIEELALDDIERPESATVPKKVGGDPIAYPEDLRKRNVTGKIKVKLTIYKDGSVKGAKVLAKENSVNKDEDPELYEQANKLLLKAVAAAVQTWKFKPSTVQGKPISVYLTVTIPFTLK